MGLKPRKLKTPNQASRTIIINEIEMSRTAIGPTLIPSLVSAKNRIKPAPAAGIGPSLLRLRLDFGIAKTFSDSRIVITPNRF
jgi:hypothetical protein